MPTMQRYTYSFFKPVQFILLMRARYSNSWANKGQKRRLRSCIFSSYGDGCGFCYSVSLGWRVLIEQDIGRVFIIISFSLQLSLRRGGLWFHCISLQHGGVNIVITPRIYYFRMKRRLEALHRRYVFLGVGGKDKQESRLMGHKNTACAMLIVIAAPEIALPTLKVVTASPHKPE